MTFWGKLIGAFFGALMGGWVGAFIGLFLGHFFDKGLAENLQTPFIFSSKTQSKIQQIYFKTTFLVMGHVAKADGRISEDEIKYAESIMKRMRLNEVQRQQAIAFFNAGKADSFDLRTTLDNLMQHCGRQRILLQMFVEIQFQAASADGSIQSQKREVLQQICSRLGFSPIFSRFEHIFGHGFGGFGNQGYSNQYHEGGAHRGFGRRPATPTLAEDFELLEVSEQCSQAELKKAYRKQMSQNHPDKLIAKGLPETMIKIATEKTQRIQAAYERICKARGW